MQEYDIVIIGAGIAGAAMINYLSKSNLKICIIDKEQFPKEKLCGGIITRKTFKLLKDFLSDEKIDEVVETKYSKANLVYESNIEFNDLEIGIVNRKIFDEFLFNNGINENVTTIFGDGTVDLNTKSQNIVLSSGEIIHYKKLIAADGVNSLIRKKISKIERKNFSYQVTTNIQNIKDEYQNKLNIFFDSNKKGYSWLIQRKIDVIIGIGDISGNTNIREDFDKLLERVCINIPNKIKGAFLPTGNDISLSFGNNIFFIGDASGIISPITGEGIYYSILTAKILANCILQNKVYSTELKRTIKRVKFELFLNKFIYNSYIQKIVFRNHKNKFFRKLMNVIIENYILG